MEVAERVPHTTYASIRRVSDTLCQKCRPVSVMSVTLTLQTPHRRTAGMSGEMS
jgi:hypothetical protein